MSLKPPPQPATGWRRKLTFLWKAPDPDLVDAGLRGEWMVASIRLLIVLLLLYFPLEQYFSGGIIGQTRVLWIGVAALAEALVIYSAVMRSWGRSWIGFFSGVLDVTLVSLTLWMFVQIDQPQVAVTDLIIFPAYLLAIGATSLRYDWRICVLTGLAAVAEYLGLVVLVTSLWDLDELGNFTWASQGGRLVLLGMATLLATTLVTRSLDLRSLSNRDRLTGLANRGFFDESLLRTAALAGRSGEPVAVAMIDVDNFKRFNDTYGHLAGDEALRTVARVLASAFRSTDLVARYGGEEFAGVFPGLKVEDAVQRLDKLRERIESTPVPIDNRGGTTHITASIGVAVWPSDGVNLKETLSIADLRLYRAKQGGRNRVVAAGSA